MKTKHLFLLLCIVFSISLHAQPTSFSPKGIGGGGAIFALSINPSNNNEYYASCDMGEVFHTTDFGLSYNQVNFKHLIGGHNSKVCFTATPGLLYSMNYANDRVVPVKSTDNGVKWSKLTGNPDDYEEIYTIDVDYADPKRVIISQYGSIFFSSDGGNTFNNIHNAATSSGNVVAGVFFDASTIYIATNDGILVSTDSGVSFGMAAISGIPSNEVIWSFAGAKSGGITRFFCLTGDASDVYPGLVGSDYMDFMKGVYAVDYGTGNWVSKMTGIAIGSDYPMFVGMAANDINTVYLAGGNSSSEPIILKTSDAGNNWINTFTTSNNKNIVTGWSGDGGDRGWSYGECPFAIAVAPNNSDNVIFGDFGFVHKTSNGGSSWNQAYVNIQYQHAADTPVGTGANYASCGLENTTCWQVHWMDADNMWACYSDIRGIRSTNGGEEWSFNYTGNTSNSTYRVVQHPVNGTLYAACSNVHDMYQSTRLADAQLDATDANGKIMFSSDKGQTWSNLHVFNHPVFWIALDPNNPNRAYASVIHYNGGNGVGGIYICNDLQKLDSSTWTLLPDPPRTEKHPASIEVLNDGKMVCTYSGRRTTSFTASSGVFIYDPTGNTWQDVSDNGMKYWTKDIVIDPNDAQQNTWYVGVFSGWGGAPNGLGGLYKTTDRGTSWKRITDSVNLDRVTSCTFNPLNPNQLFITTEVQGLWMSSDIHSPAPTFEEVTTYPFKQPERVFFNPYKKEEMWVSSFGNGMKMGTFVPTGMIAFSDTAPAAVYPNPSNGSIHLNNKRAQEVEIYNMLGERVGNLELQQGDNELNISFLKPGMYLLSWDNRNEKIIRSE